jgi:hypothetical protein
MVLSKYEKQLYYKILTGLLAFINDTYNIIPFFNPRRRPFSKEATKNMVLIRDKLWEDVSIIDA